MAQTDTIRRLYACVLSNDIQQNRVSDADIRTGIQNMKEVYKPNPTSLSSQFLDVANFNDVAHRCAYLHKYAPLHTALVCDMLTTALQQQNFKRLILEFITNTGRLDLCSLGGGPGSDILGVISVLISEFGFFQISATIVDCMTNWKQTFSSVIRELRQGSYGTLSACVQPQYFEWNYIGHNLLGKMSNDVNKAIQGAQLVTMVKFVSAAACKDTAEMIKKIFRSLKPGALVLYIDNAGGGFHQITQRCAYECSMFTVFGPLKHQHYTNENFNIKKFGYTPCLETKVTFHMWKKSNSNRHYQALVTDSDYIGVTPRIQATNSRIINNTPRMQTTNSRTINNTLNQYTVINANIFYPNASHSDDFENRPSVSQTYAYNPRQMSKQAPSRLKPIQSQPQISPTDWNQRAVHSSEDSNGASNELDCCSCCVIS